MQQAGVVEIGHNIRQGAPDIAGKGIADKTSMVEAIRLAANLATGNGLGS